MKKIYSKDLFLSSEYFYCIIDSNFYHRGIFPLRNSVCWVFYYEIHIIFYFFCNIFSETYLLIELFFNFIQLRAFLAKLIDTYFQRAE